VVDRVPYDSVCSLYGHAALAAGTPAVRREGHVKRWPWQQRWPSSWSQSSSILFNHLPRLQDIFGKDIYLAKAEDVTRLALLCMVCVRFLSSWPDGLVVYITTWNIFSCSLVCPWELPPWAARRHIGVCG